MSASTQTLTLQLTPAELAAVTAAGGGYVGIICFAPNRRGRPVRPVRTAIYRTEEAAQARLDLLLYRNPVTRREVVSVLPLETQEV